MIWLRDGVLQLWWGSYIAMGLALRTIVLWCWVVVEESMHDPNHLELNLLLLVQPAFSR